MFKINKKNNNQVLDNIHISPSYINPSRDWVLLLSISLLIMIGFVIFDYSIYKKIIKGQMYISIEEKELTLEKLDKQKINNLILEFNERIEYISNIKIQRNIDPSI